MEVRAEFTIEPFVDGAPGAHVEAAIEAVRRSGLVPEVGPFATVVTGEADLVSAAIADMLNAAREAGALRISLQIEFLS